jgi:hypothetical protein
MPIQTILRAALPFMAGGAVAIFVSELKRADAPAVRGEAFPDTWYREANRRPDHLWPGEPTFDWGD